MSWLQNIRPAFLASAIKYVLGIKRRVVHTERGRFWIDPHSQFGQALQIPKGPKGQRAKGYEPSMQETLDTLLRPGDCFVDVGANEGYFSVIAAKLVGAQGKVLAIEPQDRLQAVLEKNFQLNATTHIDVRQCVVSDQPGHAKLHLSSDMNTGSSALFQVQRYRQPTQSVEQTTLPTLLQDSGVGRVRLMKMDIESWEYEAVLGAEQLFKTQQIEYFALELHPELLEQRGKPQHDIEDLLLRCGYTLDPSLPTPVYRVKPPN